MLVLMTTALVIIDMQRGLCSGEEEAFDIGRVIENVNALIARARAADVPVIFMQHEEAAGSLVFGSEGWQIDDRVAADHDDLRLRKTTPDSFHATSLHQILRELGVGRLVLCGLQSDYCIDATVRRALSLGFHVALASDAHSTMANGVLSAAQITAHHNATLANHRSYGPEIAVLPAQEISFA